jgi:hypothetical protein
MGVINGKEFKCDLYDTVPYKGITEVRRPYEDLKRNDSEMFAYLFNHVVTKQLQEKIEDASFLFIEKNFNSRKERF